MYESFYKLTTKPFRLSPDPQFFYPSAGHKRALSYLLYGLNQGEGFVVITGTPGTGKTTLAHKLLSQIDTQSVLVAHLTSTQIEAEDLLRLVAASFKLRSENVSKAGLLKDIESFLLARSRERKRCLLVVDEAQNLPPRSIEELRMLSNFQVGSKALLQIFLLGQEQFRTMLNSPSFEQLRQRVIADFHLQPLDAEETRRYIEARLRYANWQNDPQFDAGAFAAIFEYTQGLPRRINMFCDRLMLYGFLESLHVLTRDSVTAVINELSNDGAGRHEKVVYTPVEKGEVRAATAGSVPFARIVQSEPTNTTVTAKSSQPPSVSPMSSTVVERARPPSTTPPSAVPATPSLSALPENIAPVAAMVNRNDQTSVFAPKIERETRGESVAPPLRIDQSPPAMRSAPELSPATKMPRSLAAAESRWISVLVGAIAVILIVAFWFYPSWRSTIETPSGIATAPPSPAVDDSSATPFALPSGETVEPAVSEHPSSEAPAPSADTALNSNHGGTESANTNTSEMPSVATPVAPAIPLAPATLDTTAVPAPVEVSRPEPPATTPEPPAPAATPEPPAPPIAAEPRPARNKSTGKRATTAPEPAPVASQENTAPAASVATIITERELALLLRKFARAYERGDLKAFIALFAPDVSTEDHTTVEAVRNDYAELFRKTAARDITIGTIRWDIVGDVANGTGPFEVRVRATVNEPYRVRSGTLRLRVQKKGRSIVITALYHKS